MGLNAKQKEAVEYLDGPLLVLAGPGTGKTQLLSEKVAYILKNTDTNPENILCLTFTESGTSNMRERLNSIVGKDASKVNINTYHAFGGDILAQYKNYSDSYDRNLDAAIDEVVQFKIVKDIQSKLKGTDILRGDSVKDIISVISAAKSNNLTAKNLAQIAETNIEDSKILSEAISPLLQNVIPRNYTDSLKNAYEPIYEILKDYGGIAPILKNIDRNIKSIAKDLKDAMTEATATEKIKPLSNWKDSYFEKDEKGNYRLKDRIANKKLQSLAVVMEKYEQYLADNNLYDFDDMIEEAVKALKTDEGFKLTLQEKYQFILLDEFQDTNPSQFEIVKQLTDYEKPLIMAVGDDDQAIYEFQGANATNLSDFQKHYEAHVVPLVENYRSTQEILDFSRNIINQADNRFADKELIAHKDPLPKSGIERHEFASSDTEYAWVADQVSKLIKSGVKQSDIAILSYKTKYFMPLLPYLKSHKDIKIAYEKRDNLFEDEKMHQIFTLCRFINELAEGKAPQTSLLEIMSYPFWGLNTLSILRSINRARGDKKSAIDYLADSDDEKIRTVASFIASLAAHSLSDPLDIFLDYLIGTASLKNITIGDAMIDEFRSPFLAYYTKNANEIAVKTSSSAEYEIFEFYENLAALRSKIKKHFGEKLPRLADLIEMLDDYEAADISINCVSPYRDADDAVQVMSAHKSKGLEFEYVFIISADHVAWGKGKGNNNLLSLPKNLIHLRHTGTTDGEKLRILYVAFTRAKSHLIITNSLADFNDKSPDRLEYLEEYINENKEVISPFIPTQKVTCHYEEIAVRNTENIKNWLTTYLAPSPEMRSIYKERLENYVMSASSLTSFIDIVYAGPQEFFKRQVLRAPEEPASEAIAFGNLVHATFEKVTNTGISDEAAIEFFKNELEKQEIDAETRTHILEKGVHDLEISLKAFGGLLRAGKAEVNLGPEHLTIEKVPVTGKIDHIIINEEEKTIEVYDFKTSNFHKEKWESQPTLFKYALQLGFYKLLLNASPTYSKYKISRAHILFVTQDKDGEVHDKVYEYNEKDEEFLKALIKSVYNHVKTLDFLDDPELFVAPDNNLGIKDIKEFIEVMLAKTKKII